MIAKRKLTIQTRLREHVKSRYNRITVTPKQGLFNFRCYWNAVQYSHDHPETSVVEVVYLDEGYPVLHYINKHKESGEFYETSMGYLAKQFDYYMIRDVPEDEYDNINNVFIDACDAWLYQFTNWFDRKILGIDKIV